MTDHTKPPNEQLDPKPIQGGEHLDLPAGALDEDEKGKTADDDVTAA
jgi:hypothetical protein